MAIGGGVHVGLSPLARGNRRLVVDTSHSIGSIPARAGEPFDLLLGLSTPADYPRSRGGTIVENYDTARAEGLSPLARGNPLADQASTTHLGTIPARAGEPGF